MINPYWELVILLCLINVIFAVSLNLILGYNGQFSLGHAGFLAIGAYASGVVTVQLAAVGGGIQLWHVAVGVLCAIVLSIAAAALIGYPCLRLRGDYLAIATLGFAEIIRIVLLALPKDTFGGPTGMKAVHSFHDYLAPRGAQLPGWLNQGGNLLITLLFSIVFILLLGWCIWALAGTLARLGQRLHRWAGWQPLLAGLLLLLFVVEPLTGVLRHSPSAVLHALSNIFQYGESFSTISGASNQWLVFTVFLALVLLVTWLVRNYLNSLPGRLAIAIREDEIAATNLGVNVAWMKLQNFMLGCALAGLAGALTAHTLSLFRPLDFNFFKSVDVLLMVVLGGMGSLTGSYVGAFLITVLPEVLRFLGQWRLVIYSLVLILFMLFRPGGLLGSAEIGALIKLRFSRGVNRPVAGGGGDA
jgi:ABC-type branched-subunit amino acid transport system permease subunit